MSTIWLLVRNGDHECYECSYTEHEVIAAYTREELANTTLAWLVTHFEGSDSYDVERVELDPALPFGLDGEHFPFRVQLNNNGWCGNPPDLYWLDDARAETVDARKLDETHAHMPAKPEDAPFDYVNICVMATDMEDAIDRAERRYAEWLGPDSPYHTDALRSDLV